MKTFVLGNNKYWKDVKQTISKPFKKGFVFCYFSLTENGEPIPNDYVLNNDLEIFPVFEKVIPKLKITVKNKDETLKFIVEKGSKLKDLNLNFKVKYQNEILTDDFVFEKSIKLENVFEKRLTLFVDGKEFKTDFNTWSDIKKELDGQYSLCKNGEEISPNYIFKRSTKIFRI